MNTKTPVQLISRDVTAFRPNTSAITLTVHVSVLRHGPALRAGVPPIETEWEAQIVLPSGEEISGRGDSTWAALSRARRQLEERGLRLAIAAARRDCAVINVERHRGVTVVTNLSNPKDVPGMLADTDPQLVGTVDEQEAAYQQWLSGREEEK